MSDRTQVLADLRALGIRRNELIEELAYAWAHRCPECQQQVNAASCPDERCQRTATRTPYHKHLACCGVQWVVLLEPADRRTHAAPFRRRFETPGADPV